MTERVLITGVSGFAGGFLADLYLERGWHVYGTVHHPLRPESHVPPEITACPVDLRDAEATARMVEAVHPDVVHHLAAQSSVAASWDNPLGTLGDNAAMQLALLDAIAQAAPAARILIVGSCDEYGTVAADDNPVTETHPLQPANPYALSKVVQDLLGRQYWERNSLAVVRVRPFLQIGPRRSDRFVAGAFARQVAEIQAGLRPAIIAVGTIDLERDFTDVRDMVRAYALAAEQGTPGEVYNLASGTAHSLRQVLEVMIGAAGIDAEVTTDPARVRGWESPLLIGSCDKFIAATRWKPTISFEQSARDTLAYWQDRITALSTSLEGRR
jgi:GDP-4-dehydro-6-deoxy-D-mannose reductase